MYQKSNGAFGVTNGTLADPAVGRVYVAPKPKPEELEEAEKALDVDGLVEEAVNGIERVMLDL